MNARIFVNRVCVCMNAAISECLNKYAYEMVCEKKSNRYWYSKMQRSQLGQLQQNCGPSITHWYYLRCVVDVIALNLLLLMAVVASIVDIKILT